MTPLPDRFSGGVARPNRGLRKGRGGVTVRALEARALVGGRTWNAELGDGSALELGGEWVGPGQREIMRLPATLNVPFAR